MNNKELGLWCRHGLWAYVYNGVSEWMNALVAGKWLLYTTAQWPWPSRSDTNHLLQAEKFKIREKTSSSFLWNLKLAFALCILRPFWMCGLWNILPSVKQWNCKIYFLLHKNLIGSQQYRMANIFTQTYLLITITQNQKAVACSNF